MTAVTQPSAAEPVVPTNGNGGSFGSMEVIRRRKRFRRYLIYVVLVLGALPTIMPFVWLVRSALMDNNQMFIAPPEWIPKPFEWANFSGSLTAVPFARYFLNTMVIEVITLTGTLLTCSLAAFSFSRLRWRGRNIIFGILLSGLMWKSVV